MGSQVSKPETTGPATPMTFDEKKAVIRENHIDQTKGKGETMNVSLKRSQLTDWSKDFEDVSLPYLVAAFSRFNAKYKIELLNLWKVTFLTFISTCFVEE